MSNYKMITFDIDGTLVDSKKELSQVNIDAMNKAIDAGKEVVLCTGRSMAELEMFFDLVPRLRYLVMASGAIVYDCKEKSYIYSNEIQPDMYEELIQIGKLEDCMIQFIGQTCEIEKECFEHLDRYYMSQYYKSYDQVCLKQDDLLESYRANPIPMAKINFYHTDVEGRDRTENRIKERNLPVDMVYAEKTSLECCLTGTNKGTGLIKLCEHLGITLEEVISVGDSYNDIDVLKISGLSVAVANARQEVLDLCDVTVADNDHDGCAEAVYEYLLK